ncbi:MAG TPA: cupin domain-containing protein [Gemmatimonadaceae bacterium]|nr:cupin domain-containing protein [Gemmatimonadaceae bacterium]
MPLLEQRDTRARATGGRRDRPEVSVMRESPEARVVMYVFRPGQALPLHRSPSKVSLTVVDGTGVFTTLGRERVVTPGDTVSYSPHEPHAMRSEEEELVVLATIAPSPGWG